MASVHFGRLRGPIGFARTVAIKRMHPIIANDPAFVAMFLDEARIAARIHHPNVVGTLDVVEHGSELFLVMEYVGGVSLSKLLRDASSAGVRMPPEHAAAIIVGVLHGLHAAHEACNEAGQQLSIVHRDVSPPNILVGEEGVPRVIDFGIAKATERIYATRDNGLRGKIQYMAPEQLAGAPVDRRADVYSVAVVLWELLTGRRYLDGDEPAMLVAMALRRVPEAPSTLVGDLPPAVDDVVLRGLAADPRDRFATAMEMAAALEEAILPSSQRELGEWVSSIAGTTLAERAKALREIETAGPLEERGALAAGGARVPPAVHEEQPTPELLSSGLGPHTATAWTETSHSARRRSFDLRLLAIPALAAAVVVAWMAGLFDRTSRPMPPEDGAFAVAPSFPPPPPLPPSNGEVEDTTSAQLVPAATPVAPAASASGSSARPGQLSTGSAGDAPPRARPPPPRRSCKPPYTLDHGIRVPKKECL